MRHSLLLTSVLSSSCLATQIFLSPASSSAPDSPVELSAGATHECLSSLLSIDRYDELQAGSEWLSKLGYEQASPFEGSKSDDALLILVNAPEEEISFLPDSLGPSPAISVSKSPSLESFEALFLLYAKRLVHTLGIRPSDIHGLQSFVKEVESGLETARNWILGQAAKIGITSDVRLPVQPKEEYHRLLTQFDMSDSSALTLMSEFQAMDDYVESLSSSSQESPNVALLRLEGLQQVEAKHGRLSQQYQEAAAAVKAMLSATVQAYQSRVSEDAKVILVVVPSAPATSMKKRSIEPLAPFRNRRSKSKRQMSGVDTPMAVLQAQAQVPVVPISKKCYSSADDCSDATNGCNGRGTPVKGIQAGNADCYVCSCYSNVNGTSFSGDTCEKEDYSSSFFLLAGTGLLLLLAVGGSVSLLTAAGNEELPQLLESTSSNGRKSD